MAQVSRMRAGWLAVVMSLMALGLVACDASIGQECTNDADCERGFECVSTGGVAFGDKICLMSAEAPSDAATPDDDRDASDASDTDGSSGDADPTRDAEADNCEFDGSSQGVCAQGTPDGAGGCAAPVDFEEDETSCDGVDNDCDGSVDEGCPCDFNGSTDGVCPGGMTDADGSCQPPASYSASELCDGVDNNCDGREDEGCDCTDGETQSCYSGPIGTAGVGTCREGSQTCVAGAWGSCSGEVLPSTEVCDGIDNDCDGEADEDVLTRYYLDDDEDGYGQDNDSVLRCSPDGDYTATQGGDCDDYRSGVHPGRSERCYHPTDYDCDGQPMCGDSDCDREGCATFEGEFGICHNSICVTFDDQCMGDTDCGPNADCQPCPGGNFCCPDGQSCLCPPE